MFACVVAAVGVLVSSIGGIKYGLVETGEVIFGGNFGGLDSFGGAIIAGPIVRLAESLGGGISAR
jgi:branched-chain amino acid transport system permease protein